MEHVTLALLCNLQLRLQISASAQIFPWSTSTPSTLLRYTSVLFPDPPQLEQRLLPFKTLLQSLRLPMNLIPGFLSPWFGMHSTSPTHTPPPKTWTYTQLGRERPLRRSALTVGSMREYERLLKVRCAFKPLTLCRSRITMFQHGNVPPRNTSDTAWAHFISTFAVIEGACRCSFLYSEQSLTLLLQASSATQ